MTPNLPFRQTLRRQAVLWLLCILFATGCKTTGTMSASGALTVETIAGTQPPQTAQWDALRPKKQQLLAVFMTTWCDSCKRKQPEVVRWATDNKRFARTVFIVSGSPLKEVKAMTRKRKIPSPLVLVVNDHKGHIASRYKIKATPTYVLLAPSGKILGRFHSINDVPDARE